MSQPRDFHGHGLLLIFLSLGMSKRFLWMSQPRTDFHGVLVISVIRNEFQVFVDVPPQEISMAMGFLLIFLSLGMSKRFLRMSQPKTDFHGHGFLLLFLSLGMS